VKEHSKKKQDETMFKKKKKKSDRFRFQNWDSRNDKVESPLLIKKKGHSFMKKDYSIRRLMKK
jgi:hypothetical protein